LTAPDFRAISAVSPKRTFRVRSHLRDRRRASEAAQPGGVAAKRRQAGKGDKPRVSNGERLGPVRGTPRLAQALCWPQSKLPSTTFTSARWAMGRDAQRSGVARNGRSTAARRQTFATNVAPRTGLVQDPDRGIARRASVSRSRAGRSGGRPDRSGLAPPPGMGLSIVAGRLSLNQESKGGPDLLYSGLGDEIGAVLSGGEHRHSTRVFERRTLLLR
jgi:hypothetical protein